MNCDNVTLLLDEYIDAELADADRRLVEAHLAGCALCAEACEALEREQAMYARYERPIETGDAMWAAIRSRIEPGSDSSNVIRRSFGSRRWMAPLVAAACLTVISGVGYVAWQSSGPQNEKLATAAPGPNDRPHVFEGVTTPGVEPTVATVVDHPTPTGSGGTVSRPRRVKGRDDQAPAALPVPVADAERRYIAAIALLRSEIDRTAGTDATVRDSSRKPLGDLDANIQTARRAVEQNPDDPIAVNSMLSAYDEKVETMQRLVALQARNDR